MQLRERFSCIGNLNRVLLLIFRVLCNLYDSLLFLNPRFLGDQCNSIADSIAEYFFVFLAHPCKIYDISRKCSVRFRHFFELRSRILDQICCHRIAFVFPDMRLYLRTILEVINVRFSDCFKRCDAVFSHRVDPCVKIISVGFQCQFSKIQALNEIASFIGSNLLININRLCQGIDDTLASVSTQCLLQNFPRCSVVVNSYGPFLRDIAVSNLPPGILEGKFQTRANGLLHRFKARGKDGSFQFFHVQDCKVLVQCFAFLNGFQYILICFGADVVFCLQLVHHISMCRIFERQFFISAAQCSRDGSVRKSLQCSNSFLFVVKDLHVFLPPLQPHSSICYFHIRTAG